MLYEILNDFTGSQDGRFTKNFVAGSREVLSDSLAEVAVRQGWARPVVEIDNKAIATDGQRPAGGRKQKAK